MEPFGNAGGSGVAPPDVRIEGVSYEVGAEAVVVCSQEPLTVLSSALAGGGLIAARSIANLHVAKNWQPGGHGSISEWRVALDDFAERRGLPTPYVGLATSAWTQHAEVAGARDGAIAALVLVSVGLGNPIAAGLSSGSAMVGRSTINTIVIVDALASPAALVNLVITVTEVKAAVLRDADLRTPDDDAATGTSTDAVVIAATGRGPACEFGGPISALGGLAARAARRAIGRGVAAWLERNR